MKKVYKIITLFLIIFLNIIVCNADTLSGYVSGSGVFIRNLPSTDSDSTKLIKLGYGAILTLPDDTLYEGPGCSDKWYKVKYDNIEGYMCSTYVTITNKSIEVIEDNVEPRTEYEKELKTLGFNSSYWPGLTYLHEKFPNWVFKADKLTVDWYAALNAQSVDGNSLTSGDAGYRDTNPESYNYLNDTFVVKEVSSTNRYNASDEYIAYYMDPRNWLSEKYIFQFEDLSYHNYQTVDIVKSVFTTSTNPNGILKSHSDEYLKAYSQVIDGKTYTISPVHLASRSRQEVGMRNDRTQILGTSPSFYRGFAVYGYYNFFNIGAYNDKYTTNPVARGLAYAAGEDCKVCSFNNTYGRPWNTPLKAINGGAQFIINKYFLKGQNTVYYQRYNAISSKPFTNQYMTQVEAPSSEALITANAYIDNNKTNEAIVFNIPVYINMPSKISEKPSTGNPNNHLKSISVNGKNINNFSHDVYSYDIVIAKNTKNILVDGEVINSNAKISGNGTIEINNSKIELTVTAENGKTQVYTLNILYNDDVLVLPSDIINNSNLKNNEGVIYNISAGTDSSEIIKTLNDVNNNAEITIKSATGKVKNNELLATGDIVTITSSNTSEDYQISVLGDTNGDGKISIADLLKTQKHILGANKLSGVYEKSADINNDNRVTLVDLLKIQKYILGVTKF